MTRKHFLAFTSLGLSFFFYCPPFLSENLPVFPVFYVPNLSVSPGALSPTLVSCVSVFLSVRFLVCSSSCLSIILSACVSLSLRVAVFARVFLRMRFLCLTIPICASFICLSLPPSLFLSLATRANALSSLSQRKMLIPGISLFYRLLSSFAALLRLAECKSLSQNPKTNFKGDGENMTPCTRGH